MKTSMMWMAVLLAHWAIVHAIDEDNNGLQNWKIDWTGKGGDKGKDGGETEPKNGKYLGPSFPESHPWTDIYELLATI